MLRSASTNLAYPALLDDTREACAKLGFMNNEDLFICIDHVGLAVPDLDEAITFHSEVFGWRELHREVNEEQGVAEAMIGTGEQGEENAKIQLLAPLNENSTIAKFLDRNGPGMQQLAYRVADLDHVSAVLKERGMRLLFPKRSAAPVGRGSTSSTRRTRAACCWSWWNCPRTEFHAAPSRRRTEAVRSSASTCTEV